MDQRLRLKTPGWRVLVFSGNPQLDEEVERQRARIMWTPLVRRGRDYPFCKDLITDDAGIVDRKLPILAKVSSSLEVLRLGRTLRARGSVVGTVLPNCQLREHRSLLVAQRSTG